MNHFKRRLFRRFKDLFMKGECKRQVKLEIHVSSTDIQMLGQALKLLNNTDLKLRLMKVRTPEQGHTAGDCPELFL